MRKFLTALLLILCLIAPALAAEGLEDYLFKSMPDYRLGNQTRNFNQLTIRSPKPGSKDFEETTYEGNFVYSYYEFAGNREKMPSQLQILDNYKNAVSQLGGEVLWEDDAYFHASFKRDDKQYYIAVWAYGTPGRYTVSIVEQKTVNVDVETLDDESTGEAEVVEADSTVAEPAAVSPATVTPMPTAPTAAVPSANSPEPDAGGSSEGDASEDEGPGAVVIQKDRNLLDWTQNYIEATGMAVAPKGMKGAQAKALARRGAIVDLQRNLLEFLGGVQLDARTTMDDFMASDRVRTEVSGVIRNIELLEGTWDEESYTIAGRIKLPQLRVVVASNYKPAPVEKDEVPPAKKTAGKYTGLIIDVRHLPLTPAMTFNVFDENGKAVYGMEFVDHQHYMQSGLCAYYHNINYAKGEVHVASNPISARAVRLAGGNVDIVISNGDAAKVRGSSYDFRKECKVIIVSK